jgi:hypothetical protein
MLSYMGSIVVMALIRVLRARQLIFPVFIFMNHRLWPSGLLVTVVLDIHNIFFTNSCRLYMNEIFFYLLKYLKYSRNCNKHKINFQN